MPDDTAEMTAWMHQATDMPADLQAHLSTTGTQSSYSSGTTWRSAVIPARFMLTMGHLVSLLMIVYTKKENILAGLPRDPGKARYDDAKAEFEAAYVVCLACFVFDMVGILTGTSLFFPKANLLQIICHFAGGVLVSSMIAQSWQYQYIWLVVAFCNVPTALCEIAILVAIFVLKIVVF